MNIILWILQGVIAVVFLMAGGMKMTQSKEFLKEKVGDWIDPVDIKVLKLIGLLEVLGAVGVIVPMAFGFMPMLVPLAAIGLALTMVGASFVHLQRKEYKEVAINLILLLMIGVVAVGRMELFNA